MVVVIGVTGGIASGKSSVCAHLQAMETNVLKAKTIDADKLGHKAYEIGTPCYDSLISHFGQDIIGDDGQINRRVLGGIVFGDPSQMRALESIVWPAIRSFIEEEITTIRKEENMQVPSVVILEAAVMLEAGWEDLCDCLWITHVDPSVARERLMKRNNLSQEEADKRISSQMSNNERLSKLNPDRGDVSMDNNCPVEQFKIIINERFHETLARSNPIFRFLSPLMTKARAESLDDTKLPPNEITPKSPSSRIP
jgi:dephospho-CoA kinase